MGGHWGTNSSRSDCSTVRAAAVAETLEDWTYSTSPSDRDAVVERLSRTFPGATVRRGDDSTVHDARVDDVGIVIAHNLTPSFRRDFHALADRVDDVVVYSTTCHTSTPNEWREFKHRHRGRHAGARVRFVHRRESAAGDSGSAIRTLSSVLLPVVGIAGLLAVPLGLFDAGWFAVAGLEAHAPPVGFVAALGLSATVASLLTRRWLYISLLQRIPHT